jgi:hypothetical protein
MNTLQGRTGMKALAMALLSSIVVAGCGDVSTQPPGDSSTGDGAPPDGTGDPGVDAPVPDAVDEPVPDGSTTCETEGGYCTTYSLTATPCVTCEPVGSVDHVPARGPDGANECTAEGDGVGAWCCQPLDMEDLNDCESGGGMCAPHGGERCPVGWEDDPAGTRCGGSHVCCVPGSACP